MRKQDTFEDAAETTPRPTSASRSRSLIGKRDSSASPALEQSEDVDVPEVPEIPEIPEIPNLDGAHEHMADEEPVEHADEKQKPHVAADDEAPNSPNLTSHRISVTSMDDVSLEEGKFALCEAPAPCRIVEHVAPPCTPVHHATFLP